MHRSISMWTKIVIFAVVFGAGCNRLADAQTVSGNMFAATGAFICCSGAGDVWQLGVGGDLPVTPRASVSGDYSALGVDRVAAAGRTPFFSVGGSYHMHGMGRSSRMFVSAGLGVACDHDSAAGGPFFGSGFDWWTAERQGVRVEVRDQLVAGYGVTHMVTARVAWLFR